MPLALVLQRNPSQACTPSRLLLLTHPSPLLWRITLSSREPPHPRSEVTSESGESSSQPVTDQDGVQKASLFASRKGT